MRTVFPARIIAIVVLAASVPFVPAFGDRRLLLAGALAVVLLPATVALQARSRRLGRFPEAMPILSQAFAIWAAFAFPGGLSGIALTLLGDNSLTAITFGRRFSVLVTTCGSAGLGIAAWSTGAEGAAVVIPAMAIASFATAWIIGNAGEWERATGARFEAMVGELDVLVWEMDPASDRFAYVSPAADALLGYTRDEWYAPGFWVSRLHPEDEAWVQEAARAAIADGADHTLEYRMLHKDGRTVHLRDVASVEVDAGGAAVLLRGVMVDISDRRRTEDRLREQATHDALTGLANRTLLADHLELSLREARRTGDALALLVLDLDDFKEVNDTLGHDAGDLLLAAFGDRLRNELRQADTIARLGGDEFAVLLTTDATVAGATKVAERVLELAQQPFDIGDLQLRTRASIGVAVHPDHGNDAAELLSRADLAMYLAKRSGLGVAVYQPELEGPSARRLSLIGYLRDAIVGEQLTLQFQPCFDLRSGHVVAAEALVRWTHPDEGEVPPDEFVRLAEMSGLIHPLTRWVIANAVEHLMGGCTMQISVNLSMRNLTEPDLLPWLTELIDQHPAAVGRLVLELTETEVVADVVAAAAVLNKIAALGIGLALDDFGAGQSALAYLRSLPLQELKLDRTLVEGVGSDEKAATTCEAVIGLGHHLGLRVVAEGVANADDVAALRRMECDRAQGHVLGEPRTVTHLGELTTLTVASAFATEPGAQ